KQAEVALQLPRSLAELEARIRKQILDRVSRGRLSTSITVARPEGVPAPLQVNSGLALALDAAFADLSRTLGRTVLPAAADFLRLPGVVEIDQGGEEPALAWEAIAPALDRALDQLLAMRGAEGADLAEDLLARLERIEDEGKAIASRAPSIPERQRESLLRRLRESGL